MTRMRSWQVRWWQWCLVVAALVVVAVWGTAAAIRQSGLRRYHAYLEERRAAGEATTVTEWLTTLPAVDEDLQERWLAWEERIAHLPEGMGEIASIGFGEDALSGELPPQALIEHLAVHGSVYQAGRALLQDDRLVMGLAGVAARDARRHPGRPSEWRFASLLAQRELALYLFYQLAYGDDPAAALADLDRLVAAWSRIDALLGGMIALSLHALRDQAYVHAACHGLEHEAFAAWLAEPANRLVVMADGLRAERVLHLGSFVSRFIASEADHASLGLGNDLADLPMAFVHSSLEWTALPGESARAFRDLQTIEARWRGETSAPPPDLAWTRSAWSPLIRLSMSPLLEFGRTGVAAEAGHRLHRLAVQLVLHGRRHPLPRTEVEAVALLPEGFARGADQLPLRYERLGDRRFRIGVDPAARGPDFADPSRWRHQSAFGKPATDGQIDSGNFHLEIQLP